MECSFVVGQKVAAKDNMREEGISEGDILTIAKIESGQFLSKEKQVIVEGIGLTFEEVHVHNSVFCHTFFRPLQDTAKQVEALKRLATDLPWNFDPDPNPRERVDG